MRQAEGSVKAAREVEEFTRLAQNLYRWEERIVTRIVLIDMAQDFIAGTILGRLLYWHESDKQEHTRLRVEHDGHLWLARGYKQWWGECRITEKQAERAYGILKARGLIETTIRKFDGNPTVHARIVGSRFMELWDEAATTQAPTDGTYRARTEPTEIEKPLKGKTKSPKRGKRSAPLVPIEKPQQAVSLTRDTQSVTQSTTSNNTDDDFSQSDADETAALVAALIQYRIDPTAAKKLAAQHTEEARRRMAWWPTQDTSKLRSIAAAVSDSITNPHKWPMDAQAPDSGQHSPKAPPRKAPRKPAPLPQQVIDSVLSGLHPIEREAAIAAPDTVKYLQTIHPNELAAAARAATAQAATAQAARALK